MVDDLGWQDTSLPLEDEPTEFNRRYRTPNVEALAARGLAFTDAYAPAPVCTPTRVSFCVPNSAHSFLAEGCRKLPSGEYAVYLARAQGMTPDHPTAQALTAAGEIESLPFPSSPPAILLRLQGEVVLGATRSPSGIYTLAEGASFEFQADLGDLAEDLGIGLEWDGVRSDLGQLRPEHSHGQRQVRFTAPAEGVSLRWSWASEDAVDQVPLTSTTSKVRIPS